MGNRAEELKRIIGHLDTLWERNQDCVHPDTGEEVANTKYDAMRLELEGLIGKDDPFFHAPSNSQYTSPHGKIRHDPPMTSIKKACHEDRSTQEVQLFKWMASCVADAPAAVQSGPVFDLDAKEIGGVQHPARTYDGAVVTYPRDLFSQTYKLDGLALGLYYEKGQLVRAGLRPRDGINGEDVTKQVTAITGVPETLNLPLTCSIRGEVVCLAKDFAAVQADLQAAGEKLRANPRNHVAGALRADADPKRVKEMRLTFRGVRIVGLDNPPFKTMVEMAKFANKELGIPFVRSLPFNFYQLQEMEEAAKDLDYEVDGVVISVNPIDVLESMGNHGDSPTGDPRGMIAWKFEEERATPVIKEIVWQTGRTGGITPVAVFDAVPLAGTQVARATLHNAGFIFRNGIGVGTKIIVLKSGKIIPKVIGTCGGEIQMVDAEEVRQAYPNCPSCGNPVRLHETPAKGSQPANYDLVCGNPDCPAQNIGQFAHFLERLGVLGIGEGRLEPLLGGPVKDWADLYRLTPESCQNVGMSERQSLLVVAAIHGISKPEKVKDDDSLRSKWEEAKKTKKVYPLWQIIAAMGIPNAGRSTGKQLVEHFGNFQAIIDANETDLAAVIGDKTAKVVREFLDSHIPQINDLLKYVEVELPKTGRLSGKKFCLTGGFSEGKKYWENAIEDAGGTCSGSVGKSTSYVVVGTDAGAKAEKAEKLGIPKITVDDLQKML